MEKKKKLQRQCTHLKHASHAKVKYGVSSFAVELNIEDFAWK